MSQLPKPANETMNRFETIMSMIENVPGGYRVKGSWATYPTPRKARKAAEAILDRAARDRKRFPSFSTD
jgi:hypothetical protein